MTALEETSGGRQQGISGYRPGAFRIGGIWHTGDLLLVPAGILPWRLAARPAIDLSSLAALREITPAPEILLLGLGRVAPPLRSDLRLALRSWGLAAEAMTTPAACRTFNVLLAEERRVVAALLALED